MGYWFPKKGRGFVLGIWSSTSNIGNIFGAVLAHILFDKLGFSWMWTYIVSDLICFGYGILVFLVLVEHPSRVGLEIREEEGTPS